MPTTKREPAKRKPAPAEPTPSERLYRKVAALGDDAPLELDEVAAYWSVSRTTAETIVTGVPLANPIGRIRRWRYGDVRAHFADMVRAG